MARVKDVNGTSVFITPKGDSKGLYVTNETAVGFEVHESAGGRTDIGFDDRIVARRKGYETVRLADKTKEMDGMKLRARGSGTGHAENALRR